VPLILLFTQINTGNQNINKEKKTPVGGQLAGLLLLLFDPGIRSLAVSLQVLHRLGAKKINQ
jgi:hypothetical protein